MNIMTLNVLGLGEYQKVTSVRKLVRSHKLSFNGIQETQLADADNINVANCWGSDQCNADKVHATGRSGGLTNIWDPLVFTSMDVIKSRYFLINISNWVGIDKLVILANIYGPRAIPEKEKLLDDLLNLMERRKGIWILLGDFNAVRRDEERFNSNLCARSAMVFNRFIHDGGLHDLKMGGHRFTYFCHDDLKLSKLDRFLVCSDFLSIFPNVVVTALPRETSDHCPILLSTTSLDFGPTPFRFLIHGCIGMAFQILWRVCGSISKVLVLQTICWLLNSNI